MMLKQSELLGPYSHSLSLELLGPYSAFECTLSAHGQCMIYWSISILMQRKQLFVNHNFTVRSMVDDSVFSPEQTIFIKLFRFSYNGLN